MFLDDNGNWIGEWRLHPEDSPIITKEFIYLFADVESGEEFIVQFSRTWNFLEEDEPEALEEAYEIAQKYFEDVEWIDEITEEEADRLGLDTYTE